jgi:hypothetical protein
MPLAATSDPRLFRLLVKGLYEDKFTRGDVICLLRLVDAGVEVIYLYHQFYRRQTPDSAWQIAEKSVTILNEQMRHQIGVAAMVEVWRQICLGVRSESELKSESESEFLSGGFGHEV